MSRITVAALVAALTFALTAAPAGARATSPSVDWFDVTNQTVLAAAFPEPVTQSDAWATSWLAAARAAQEGPNPRFQVAAFAGALHDVLAALVPARQSQLDDALAATLDALPDGSQKNDGLAAGREQAQAALEERSGDGLDTASVDPAWSPPSAAPGVWQPTPPSFGPAVRAGQRFGRAFLLATNDQFRPGPPPALDSATYLDDLAEVHAVGAATSSRRTPAQTDVARFWAQNSIDAYNQVLRAVLAGDGGSVVRDARLVAAFHAITTDAQIAIYDAKYAYVFWRPVTAIRTGSTDPDSEWTPLINTPRHPEYPSGHTGYAGAAEATLKALAGPRPLHPVAVTSSTAPGSTHTFTAWSQITQENVDARVWSGIHYRFSDEAGASVGRQVAGYDLGRLGALGI